MSLRNKSEITRETDVYYCNKDNGWKIKLIRYNPVVLPVIFKHRFQALKYEKEFLDALEGEDKKWSEVRRCNK